MEQTQINPIDLYCIIIAVAVITAVAIAVVAFIAYVIRIGKRNAESNTSSKFISYDEYMQGKLELRAASLDKANADNKIRLKGFLLISIPDTDA